MSKIVELHELKAGDVIESTGEIVEHVQVLGPITIIDFTNGTATPPFPSRSQTKVIR